MAWHLLPVTDAPEGDFIRPVSVAGRQLLLIRSEEKLYLTASKCPHAGAWLGSGWCRSGKLICPYHRYEYDLATGRGAAGQNDYIETYPLEIREDGIYAAIPDRFSLFKKLFRL
jgi:nitrite reductase/ring-hydroxylating ferredoxin subunit